MSNTLKLSDLRTRVRRRADMENTQFVSDDELTQYVNDSLCELYDLFVSKYEEYIIQSLDTTLSGEEKYSITDDFGIDNFMKIVGIDIGDSSSGNVAMQRFMFSERNQFSGGLNVNNVLGTNMKYAVLGNDIMFLNDTGTTDIKIWFIPIFTPMIEADQLDDVMPFLAPGWEEYAVIDSAIKCLIKEESDTRDLERDLMRLRARIESIAMNRDSGSPYRVTDVNANHIDDYWFW